MKSILIYIIIAAINITALSAETSLPDNNIDIGLQTGVRDVRGYYKDQLDDGFLIGAYSFFSMPRIYRYLSGELDFSYTRYILKESTSSQLISALLNVTPMLYYPVFKYFHPYAGISIGVNYLHITTKNTNESEKTYKPAFSASTGFFIPIFKPVNIRLSLEHSVFVLSNEKFYNTTFEIGASYRISMADKRQPNPDLENILMLDELYNKGIRYIKAGDGKKAANVFIEILEKDKDYKDAASYLDIINENETKYINALKLIKEEKYYDALPILIELEKHLIEALEKLAEVRSILSSRIKKLERRAINLYDKKKYKQCITVLEKINNIDTDNKIYTIYYQKAVKRYNAIKLLK